MLVVTQAKPQGTIFQARTTKNGNETDTAGLLNNKYDRDDKGAKAGPPPFREEIRSFGSGAKGYRRR
ncbi:hypothetical protein GCM10011572_46390 [Pseudoduganella buxea]|uniref:Uncharacterized protein n=1 Tax=Pseudoduganella buxea TaxID=1949069 RepID=A0ABQ1LA84_9BURK|nr:hypothetical protein GCM10011572_46390 [Pseudoduganella buxea]